MKTVGKTLLYLLFLVLASFCFSRFRAEYAGADVGDRRFGAAELARDTDTTNEPVAGVDPVAGAVAGPTNAVPGSATNAAANAAAGTNAPADAGTNAVVASAGPGAGPGGKPAAVKPKGSRSGLYLAGFVGALLGMAGLLGWDITQWFANKAAQGLGADLKPIEGDPDYDAAEAEWAKGNHLDAITMLRDFLKRNPSQQHAAIRIAEIYEKDLNNFLAAALELEEVLNRRLPREKWGWTAIHLANIYSGRLNQADKALATLERIVRDYPETAAAKKARQRLGLPEPADVPAGEMAAEGLAEGESENPGVPRGFKPKKR